MRTDLLLTPARPPGADSAASAPGVHVSRQVRQFLNAARVPTAGKPVGVSGPAR
ncbi:hypothetical protein Vse01_08920 [Micromonospora sediminimaris]|uniref:Uncharacterized protein n=1 Tax=Micromonospora sediminimaris TaxID=547162 RepID=A0A9W5XID5_9ACTN|nr:hypothetical protein Vse01_08920 [Micromonospora sediminimaris]